MKLKRKSLTLTTGKMKHLAMKSANYFSIILIVFVLSSCATPSYFQIYKAEVSNNLEKKSGEIVYEDENCKISYDLWAEGGDVGFQFFNKSDKNIYVNLEECFFVLNGVAYDYFQNRTYIRSVGSGSSLSSGILVSNSIVGMNSSQNVQANKVVRSNSGVATVSSGFSVSYSEDKIICIPSGTSKIIAEFAINQTLIRDCDLFKYPTRRQINTKYFSKSDSPLVFSNRITYSIGDSSTYKTIENEFYISEVTNYPESEVFEMKYKEYCNQKSMVQSKSFKNRAADMFYIKYLKGQDVWKH